MSVVLRPVEERDATQVLAWRNSQAVAPYMYSDHHITPAEHQRWLKAVLCDDARRYWVIEWNDRPVGLANVVAIDHAYSRCEWAYYLADPEVRGQGVGACVEYLVLRYVFEQLRLNKLWCEVFASNVAVWRLHESFGFRREAELRAHVRKGRAFHDVIGLGMLRTEWPAAKAEAEARLRARGYDPSALQLREARPPTALRARPSRTSKVGRAA